MINKIKKLHPDHFICLCGYEWEKGYKCHKCGLLIEKGEIMGLRIQEVIDALDVVKRNSIEKHDQESVQRAIDLLVDIKNSKNFGELIKAIL